MNREEIVALDRRLIWPPYTSSESHQSRDPLVISRAEGSWLYDVDGQSYLDASGAWWCNNLGFRHPRILSAMQRQVASLAHCSLAGSTHEPAALLAQELVEIAPKGLTRVFYSDNGSTAVEVGLKMAFQHWQQNGRPGRTRFLSLPGAYHGDTIGAMSVGSLSEIVSAYGPLLFEKNEAAAPKTDNEWRALIGDLCQQIVERSDEIAGVIVEPVVLGVAGMRMYPPQLLADLRAACDQADTFLIADEVFTGFGRTGPMWACDLAGISPDILCTAKGLSAGTLPFSATLASDRVYQGFVGGSERALLHGHTFCGNPLGAAVAREVLAIYREERVLDAAAKKASIIAAAFAELGERKGIKRARSLGMIGACDLGESGYHGKAGWRVHEAARARGIALRPLGDVVYAVPPLTIDDDDLRRLLRGIQESIDEILRGG